MSDPFNGILGNARVLRVDASLAPGHVHVADGKIVAVYDDGEPLPDGVPCRDVRGAIVTPGMLDVLIHGHREHGFSDTGLEAIRAVARLLPATGVTGFYPALYSLPLDDVRERLRAIRPAFEERDPLAAPALGVHMEGPYFSVPGAHNVDFLETPDPDRLQAVLDEAAGLVKITTLAPELPGAIPLIGVFRRNGVVVSLGHTNANVAEVGRAVAAGATAFTHVYDTIEPGKVEVLGLYPAGLAEAVLYYDELTATVICDGFHVSPFLLRFLVKFKRPERIVLMTDSIRGAGLDGYEYVDSRGKKIVTKLGEPILDVEGDVCGSSLTLDRAVRNMVRLGGTSVGEALTMATRNPARLMGFDRRKGLVAPGYDADLVVWDDDLVVTMTLIGGRVVYEADA